jgi:hypothetical protein
MNMQVVHATIMLLHFVLNYLLNYACGGRICLLCSHLFCMLLVQSFVRDFLEQIDVINFDLINQRSEHDAALLVWPLCSVQSCMMMAVAVMVCPLILCSILCKPNCHV